MTRSSLLRLILIQILILSSFLPFLAACASAPGSDLESPPDFQGLTPTPAPTRPLAPSPTSSPTSPTTPLFVLPDKPGAAGGAWTEAEARELTRQAEALWADVHAIAGAHPPADVAQVQPVVTERDGQWLVVGLRLSGQDAAQVYGEGAVLTIGIDPKTQEKGMLTLSLDGAKLALTEQADLDKAQITELGLVGPVFMDGRWLVFDKEGLPRVVVNEKNQWQTLTVLETANTPLTYFVSTDTLYLWSRDRQQFDVLTFQKEITEVQAKGQEALKVTLADGTEKTLAQDKETGEWKEAQVYRELIELAPTAENMPVIKDAVADALAGGTFLDEAEIKAKIEAGELKVVRDEKTGAVIVFPKQALDYMKENGQGLDDSDFAYILERFEQRGRELDKYYDVPRSGKDLQTHAEAIARKGGFQPLPPEYMKLVARLGDTGKPEIVMTLPPFIFDLGYRRKHQLWRETFGYPTELGRPFGDPILYGSKADAILGMILYYPEDDGVTIKATLPLPYSSQYRQMQLLVEETGAVVLGDEYGTATHEWSEKQKDWEELEKYRVYGTPEERLKRALVYKVLEENRIIDGEVHTNVFGLDKEKVQAVIDALEAGKSIEEINANEAKAAGIYILVDAEGNPAQVAIVGGEYGLTAEQLANLKKAAAGIEAVDPGRLTFLAEQFGAKFIASKTKFINVDNRAGTFSSNNYQDTIIAKSNSVKTVADFIIAVLAESGEIHVGRHMTSELKFADKMSKYRNVGVFASQWTIDWLKLHGDGLIDKGVINQKELNDIINLAKHNLKHYQDLP